ncbi:LysM peptidoglycan-binding domain-containing protein [Gramella sp. BOM4]|nr:LysM peptidoglycan-binding domain-containing protein [Christiangramia bathymodioli]
MKYLLVICFLFQITTISANAQAYKYHTVKKGETVFSISQTYDIEEEDIYKYNPDAKSGIGVNEKLVIPIQENQNSNASAGVKFREHKVQRKETLYSLSKQYEVSIDDIKRFNKHLYAEELESGETIRIPVSGTIPVNNPVASQTAESKPKSPQDLSKTREHIVLPKETKFGIARKYGMTLEELNQLNPKVDVIQPGMMIRVGTNVLEDEPVIITDERFRFYEVKPQETLFSLSQRFGVSQDSLKRLNPALEDGLKYGMVLKVPEKENPDFNEEEYAFAEGKGNVKVNLENSLSNFRTKEIALMLPLHLDKIEKDSLETYRNTILDERVVRISLDFYSGVLMAVEDAKSMGISTNLKVYDTKRQASEVANIINTNNFSNTDAVIGPLLKETTEVAASRLENRNIPVITPLSNREMQGYNNLFQARPTDEFLRKAMMDYIVRNSSGKNVIVIADGNNFRVKSELGNMLPSARFVNPVDKVIKEDQLKNALVAGPNWVILESDNISVLSSATSLLNRLAREHDITLLTTNKNNTYEDDNISNMHLGRLNFHYPSVDKEYDTTTSQDFIDAYNERFGNEPNQFAVRGYDLAMDVLLRLASAENLMESFERYPGYTEYYESKFHYLPNPNGGFMNDAIYILKFNEDLTISKANDF